MRPSRQRSDDNTVDRHPGETEQEKPKEQGRPPLVMKFVDDTTGMFQQVLNQGQGTGIPFKRFENNGRTALRKRWWLLW